MATEGVSLPFIKPPPLSHHPRRITADQHVNLLLQDLLAKGAINRVSTAEAHKEPGFYSRVFTVPKPGKKERRFIIDLRHLNQHLNTPHVKFERLKDVLMLIHQGDFLTSVDLTDAYYHLPVNKQFRRYLRFAVKDQQSRTQVYEFVGLPMGLSVSPAAFTKLMKLPLTLLREQGTTVTAYLDDWLIVAKTKEEAAVHTKRVIKILQEFGFCIHMKKSELEPEQKRKFLGMDLDTTTMTVSVPTSKLQTILKILVLTQRKIQHKENTTARELASLVGKINALSPAIQEVRLHKAQLNRVKTQAVHRQGWLTTVSWTPQAIKEVDFWTKNIKLLAETGCCWSLTNPEWTLHTDASDTGFGGTITRSDQPTPTNQKVWGTWTKQEVAQHINHRELLAVLKVLHHFVLTMNLTNTTIKVMSDNIVTVAYLNKTGGRIPELNYIMTPIWDLCKQLRIQIISTHIKGELNGIADGLSRMDIPNNFSTAQLQPSLFKQLTTLHGPLSVDLFASQTNNQLTKFVSWKPETTAMATNAFSLQWNKLGETLYAFPPFAVIPKFLRKIQDDHASVIAVLPLWKSAIWWPQAMSLTQKVLLTIPKQTPAFLNDKGENMSSRWDTIAVLLSASSPASSQPERNNSSPNASETRRTNPTKLPGNSLPSLWRTKTSA